MITSQSLESVNVTLFNKRIFVDVAKDFEMRKSSWLISVGPKSNDTCPYERLTEQVK